MRPIALFVAAAAASLSLSGCSLIPGMGSQSGIQACAVIGGSLQKAADDLQSVLNTANGNPQAAQQKLNNVITELESSRDKVTNPDVGAALDKATEGLKTIQAELESAGSDPSAIDETVLRDASDEVSQAMTELATACTKI